MYQSEEAPCVFSYKLTQQGDSGNAIFLKCTFDMFIFFIPKSQKLDLVRDSLLCFVFSKLSSMV